MTMWLTGPRRVERGEFCLRSAQCCDAVDEAKKASRRDAKAQRNTVAKRRVKEHYWDTRSSEGI